MCECKDTCGISRECGEWILRSIQWPDVLDSLNYTVARLILLEAHIVLTLHILISICSQISSWLSRDLLVLSLLGSSYLCLQAPPLLCCSELDTPQSLAGSLAITAFEALISPLPAITALYSACSPGWNQVGLEVPMRILALLFSVDFKPMVSF